ncbi:MAG: NADH-ubiquinone oxidoreductase subunit E family protein [Campylobacterota bacterium]|nr:NADH-ubiquinone oxidoreductase subunit E family protein [Campylobacterota bacterium]
MKRYDLRNHKENFLPRMVEIMNTEISDGENGIFLFEIGDFSSVQASADCVKENSWTLMNSLKFNEVDWTVVIKKEKPVVEAVEEAAE